MENVIGQRMKELRIAKKLTGEKLANLIGVKQPNVSSFERGTKKPSLETLAKIAKVFDVSTDYLMGVTDHPHNASPAFAVILREFLEDTPSALEEICKQTGISASVIEQYAAGAEEPSGGRMRVIHEAMKSLGWRPRLVGNAPKGKGRAPVFDVPNSRGDIVRIPILSPAKSACCGPGFPNSEEIYADMTDYLDMPSAVVGTVSPDPDLRPYFIHADGDSMINAGIIHGSMALVNPAESVYDGESALVAYGVDGNVAIKRVYWLDNGAVRITSADGTDWTRTFTHEEIQDEKLFRIIGKIMFAGVKPKRG